MPHPALLRLVTAQLKIALREATATWAEYGRREQTRREHLAGLQAAFGFEQFAMRHYRPAVNSLDALAWQTDKGIVLATAVVESLRQQSILLPAINVIERICAEAITRATRRIYAALTSALTEEHHRQLDALLNLRENSKTSTLTWLRQSPGAPNAKHLLGHIDRLEAMDQLMLPVGLEREIHQNRLLKLAREGAQMTAQHLRDLESARRYATLVAVLLETKATVIDEIVDLHDRIIGTLFNRAKRQHEQQFQQSGEAINEKLRLYGRIGQALLEAKQAGGDPFAAIESVISWNAFTQSVTEAQRLAQTENFDYLHRLGDGYTQIRRYAPAFLEVLTMKAAPAARDLLAAVEVLKTLNVGKARKVPSDAPTSFVKRRWQNLVFTEGTEDDGPAGVDRRFYELCALSELKNALRSGDIWVQGSRQFKDFEDYLLPS